MSRRNDPAGSGRRASRQVLRAPTLSLGEGGSRSRRRIAATSSFRAAAAEALDVLLREHEPLRDVEADDRDVRSAAVEFVRGVRVAEGVRLRARVDVAVDEEGAAEVDDLSEVLDDGGRIGAQRERHVRRGREGDDGDLARVPVRGLDDELRRGLAADHLGRRRGLVRVPAIRAVDEIRCAPSRPRRCSCGAPRTPGCRGGRTSRGRRARSASPSSCARSRTGT